MYMSSSHARVHINARPSTAHATDTAKHVAAAPKGSTNSDRSVCVSLHSKSQRLAAVQLSVRRSSSCQLLHRRYLVCIGSVEATTSSNSRAAALRCLALWRCLQHSGLCLQQQPSDQGALCVRVSDMCVAWTYTACCV